jgi:hypothetical protein
MWIIMNWLFAGVFVSAVIGLIVLTVDRGSGRVLSEDFYSVPGDRSEAACVSRPGIGLPSLYYAPGAGAGSPYRGTVAAGNALFV